MSSWSKGGDEGPIEGDYDLVGNPITLALQVLDLPLASYKVRRFREGLFEQIRSRRRLSRPAVRRGRRTDARGE